MYSLSAKRGRFDSTLQVLQSNIHNPLSEKIPLFYHILQTFADFLRYQNNYISATAIDQILEHNRPEMHLKKRLSVMQCGLCDLPVNTAAVVCLSCGHVLHANCHGKWFKTKSSCPISDCRCFCNKISDKL